MFHNVFIVTLSKIFIVNFHRKLFVFQYIKLSVYFFISIKKLYFVINGFSIENMGNLVFSKSIEQNVFKVIIPFVLNILKIKVYKTGIIVNSSK